MAENKKSFLMYVDNEELFEELSDEDAGQLIKHIFKYVSDKNPTTENKIVRASFILIKQQLKRDLIKYEAIKERNKINGNKGGRPKKDENEDNPENPVGYLGNPKEPKKPVKDNDIDKGNDTGKEIKNKKFNFKNSLLELVPDEILVNDYIALRKLKQAPQTETVFNSLVKECTDNNYPIKDALRVSIERNWQGFKFEWLKNPVTQNQNKPYVLPHGRIAL